MDFANWIRPIAAKLDRCRSALSFPRMLVPARAKARHPNIPVPHQIVDGRAQIAAPPMRSG
ncbi:MAG: hypothetical protein WDZ46_03880 [Solirubrobacterales bacterium]